MAIDIREESFEEVEVLGKPALFITLRILDKTVPPNLYCYDLRHEDEDWSIPAQIEKFVMVNHFGTIVTREPLDLGEKGFLSIPPGAFRHDIDHDIDVDEWRKKEPVSDRTESAQNKQQKRKRHEPER